MVPYPYLLRKIEKQSSFAGIHRTALVTEQVSLTVLHRQVNTKPGMLSLFKIHGPITGFGSFFFRSH
jgi:hypothetical protein